MFIVWFLLRMYARCTTHTLLNRACVCECVWTHTHVCECGHVHLAIDIVLRNTAAAGVMRNII